MPITPKQEESFNELWEQLRREICEAFVWADEEVLEELYRSLYEIGEAISITKAKVGK